MFNVKKLPVAANVCDQVLREVIQEKNWSMAHVSMNPFRQSLYHMHEKMAEIYVINKGYGLLAMNWQGNGMFIEVGPGSVIEIPTFTPHMLTNLSAGPLEHLVFALPPFDPKDVQVLYENPSFEKVVPFSLPEQQECFDGAKIISYEFGDHDLSIAFGSVINDIERRKKPHFHKTTTEFVFVVEGQGYIELDGKRQVIQANDWLRIDPMTEHRFINEAPEDMVVQCICSPKFDMNDVHYR
jgi:mannose-6-phosphate isomerase-like protein (cupin superfamily)